MGSDSPKSNSTTSDTTTNVSTKKSTETNVKMVNNSTTNDTITNATTTNDSKKNGTTTNDITKNVKKENGRKRLIEEFNKLMNDPDNNCFTVDYWDPDVPNPDIFHWQITLIPPEGTYYEGGFFKIEAKFSEDYPLVAPKMKFLTKIFHCNIDNLGHICINTLARWKKSYTMEDLLYHIIILLSKQNPASPVNGSAAELYIKNLSEFKEKVKQYIKDYANKNDYEDQRKQEIKILDKCNCYNCNKIYRSIE